MREFSPRLSPPYKYVGVRTSASWRDQSVPGVLVSDTGAT